MAIYFLNICLIFVLSFLLFGIANRRYRDTIFLFLIFIQLFVVSAMRYEIGIDFINYRGIFRLVRNVPNLSELVRLSKVSTLELGYLLLNKTVGGVTKEPQWIFVITSFIILSFIFLSIKKYSSKVWLSVYLFCVGPYISSFNLVRQYIAVGILFFSYQYIKERKLKQYLLLMVLASTFHISALLLIPLYFILNINLNKKNMFITIAISVLIVIFFKQIILIAQLFFYSYYTRGSFGMSKGNVNNLLIAFMYFFSTMLFRNDLLNKNKDNKFLINWSFINFILSIISMRLWIITRLMAYSGVFNVLLIPEVVCSIKNKNTKIIIGLVFIILTLILHIYTLINPMNRLVPYQRFR